MSIRTHLPAALLLCLPLAWGAPPAAAQETPAPAAAPSASAAGTPASQSSPGSPASPASPASAAVAAAPAPGAAATSPAGAAGADAGQTQSSVAAACLGEDGPKPSSPKLARVHGVISAPEDKLHRATLTLQDHSTGNRWVVNQFEACPSHGSATGRFAYSSEVLPGTYDLTLSGRFYETESVSNVTINAGEIKDLDFSLVKEDTSVHPAILALPLVFLLSIWLIRWNNIAKPSRLGVITHLRDVQGQLPPGSRYGDALGDALQELQRKVAVLDWLFWSRGQEIASMILVHRAELALLEDPSQTSLDKINARLASVEQRLAEVDKSAARSLAQRVSTELACDRSKISEPARRQLLLEATSYLYEAGDTDFAALTGWQNKSFWLTLVGLALIWSVGLTEGHGSLFLAGAVGGFLSRLTRELKRADVASDYGASWSTLFLSPVAGAISGWFGVALIMLMTDPTVGVLGGPLKVINWDSANVAATLAAAFILGFSERLFDRIVSQLDTAIDKRKDEARKTAPQASPSQRGAPAAAGKPALAAPAPNPVAAGGEVAAQLENLDAGKVTGVVLAGAGGDLAPLEPRFAEGQLKFTVAADTAPGTYRIVLLTPELTPDRTETDQNLTVSDGDDDAQAG
jgi:hypothetical protein